MNYIKHLSPNTTTQAEPLFSSTPQVENNSGGFVWEVDHWTRLERFLILGCEGGSYYTGEREMTRANASIVEQCTTLDPNRTAEIIACISEDGRAPKNDAAIFALALVASSKNWEASRAALCRLDRVCRIPTHLFQFLSICKELRGWGRGFRNAVAAWYKYRNPEKLAYQVTKYRNRHGFTHRDVLRLCHVKTGDGTLNSLFKYITQGTLPCEEKLKLVVGFDLIQKLDKRAEDTAAMLIKEHGLTLEHVPNTLLGSSKVWGALLPNLPMTALIRNLGKMTAIGMLKPLSSGVDKVCETLTNKKRLHKSRIHPLSILLARTVYEKGSGVRGSLQWQASRQVVDALEEAFYASFKNVEPTGKRHLLALDVSGSMSWNYCDNGLLSCAQGAACMAMATARTEPKTHIVGFSDIIKPLAIGKHTDMRTALQRISSCTFGSTDCAQPMMYAMANELEVDVFVVYTDNETWAGHIHPSVALKQYRRKMGIDAKLIVVGMQANPFTIADPNDTGMLDMCGFDASAPQVIKSFVG